jgi:hypothetical protein
LDATREFEKRGTLEGNFPRGSSSCFFLQNFYAGNHPIGIFKDLIGRNPAFQRPPQEKIL